MTQETRSEAVDVSGATAVGAVIEPARATALQVWTVANQKGGVGKTTTVVTLAGLLAREGKRVLMLDLDPQGSLSVYFEYSPETNNGSVYNLFVDEPADLRTAARAMIQETHFDNIQLLPAASVMATLDRKLGARTGKGLVIRDLLRALQDEYDHVLIDCSPSLGILLVNALAACNHLIIPVQTEFLAVKGLERMLHTLKMIAQSTGRVLPYMILPTMYDRRTRASTQSLEFLREAYGQAVWDTAVPVNTEFREASRTGIPLSMRSPQDRAIAVYRELCHYLMIADQVEQQ